MKEKISITVNDKVMSTVRKEADRNYRSVSQQIELMLRMQIKSMIERSAK